MKAMPATWYYVILVAFMVLVVIVICCSDQDDDDNDRADQPAESAEQRVEDDQPAPPVESAEQRVARALAEWQALAARAEAVLAARAEMALTGQVAAPPVLLPLPYFPYAGQPQGDKPAETTTVVECAICLEPLRPGQLCSEVPPCRHVFHGDCLGEWARSNGSCPLCRAKIVPGSDEVAIADDMV